MDDKPISSLAQEAQKPAEPSRANGRKKKKEPGNGFMVHCIYPLIHLFLWLFLRLYHWPRFRGRENLPKGPCVICANHSGLADPFWVALLMGTHLPPWSMARSTLFRNRLFASFLRSLRAFPVDRDNPDLTAIKKALSLLKRGEYLLIFPEGTRVKGNKRSQPKSGAVMLAQRAGVPIVPVYVTHGRKPFQPVLAVMGEAYTPAFSSRRPDAAELERHTAELMQKIYELPKDRAQTGETE